MNTKKHNESAKADGRNIYERLSDATKEIPTVVKTKNKGMPFKTVSHDDGLEAVRGPLLRNGVIAIPSKLEFTQDGNRSQAIMNIRFQNIYDKDDYQVVPSVGQGIGNDDKGPGKAMSYAFKYALLKTLAIKTGDDADNEHTEDKFINKDADAAKKRIEMQIQSIETEEDLKEFRANNKLKEDLKTVHQSNPKIADQLKQAVKDIQLTK